MGNKGCFLAVKIRIHNCCPFVIPVEPENLRYDWAVNPCLDLLFKERLPKKRQMPSLRVIEKLLELEIADRALLLVGEVNEALSDVSCRRGRHRTSKP